MSDGWSSGGGGGEEVALQNTQSERVTKTNQMMRQDAFPRPGVAGSNFEGTASLQHRYSQLQSCHPTCIVQYKQAQRHEWITKEEETKWMNVLYIHTYIHTYIPNISNDALYVCVLGLR